MANPGFNMSLRRGLTPGLASGRGLTHEVPMREPMNFGIQYLGDGYSTEAKLMGRQAAGKALLKGITDTWPEGPIFGFGQGTASRAMLTQVRGNGYQGKISWWEQGGGRPSVFPTAIYHPGPLHESLAHARNKANPRAYSLFGVTHTLSSTGVMDALAAHCGAPFQPWDALICTSLAGHRVVETLIAERRAWLKEHFGATRFAQIQLPVIPLGVDVPAQARSGEDIAEARARFEISSHETVFFFAGRLSFHAKANPAPIYVAMERAAQASGRALVCLEAGQYFNPDMAVHFQRAQQTLAPSVRFIHVDGSDSAAYRQAWCAADVFTSISDNIQETFGLTPVEAMAAGLPVLVSDWDGYKDTVRDGVDGYRIPVVGLVPGGADDLAERHALGVDTYDRYIGQVSMATSVDVGQLAQRIQALAEDPALRIRLGESGQARARAEYDWPVVLRRYQALVHELDRLRVAAPPQPAQPWLLRPDPTHLFSHFPTHLMGGEWRVRAEPGRETALAELLGLFMVNYVLDPERLPADLITDLHRLAMMGPKTVGQLLKASGGGGRPKVRALMWLAKSGLVELSPPR